VTLDIASHTMSVTWVNRGKQGKRCCSAKLHNSGSIKLQKLQQTLHGLSPSNSMPTEHEG